MNTSPSFNWPDFLTKPVLPACNDHMVQFYRDEGYLARAVGHYVATGLLKGEAVIVIATESHWELIQKELIEKKRDPLLAIESGQLLFLDAAATLARFMEGDVPNQSTFTSAIGEIFKKVRKKYPRIRAFGEMVEILSSQGNSKGTNLLESYWNDLSKTYSFSLLCGYLLGGFGRESDAAAFDRVCKHHTHVLPSEDFSSLVDDKSRTLIIAQLQQQALALKGEIEERKQIENALRESEKKLQEALHIRDEFLSIASHELKTPVTSLKIQLQMALRSIKAAPDNPPSIEKLTRVFEVSNRQVQRLTGLIDELLAVSKIKAGKLTYHFEPVDLSLLVCDILEGYSEAFMKAKIAVELELSEGLVGNWDRGRIEQVISNLLSNVIKYASHKPVRISATGDGERATLTIKDFGPGIPREEQTRIFERFERAVPSNHISGLGLGLYIVKQIIDAHVGTITVDSQLGSGCTFTISLPL